MSRQYPGSGSGPAPRNLYPFTTPSNTATSSSRPGQQQQRQRPTQPSNNPFRGQAQPPQMRSTNPFSPTVSSGQRPYPDRNPYSPASSSTNLLPTPPPKQSQLQQQQQQSYLAPGPGPGQRMGGQTRNGAQVALVSPASSSGSGQSPQPQLLRSNSAQSNSENRYNSSPLNFSSTSLGVSASEKYNLSPDPAYFLKPNEREEDDYLHNPDPRRDRKNDRGGHMCTQRGIANLGCLILLCVILVGLFAGYPLTVFFTSHPLSKLGAFNLGGTNASGQTPLMAHGRFSLIDPETPPEALTVVSTKDGSNMDLVFSDEFNTDNRTFWAGDDPFWEAVDLHYWQTNNLEWYYPDAITTSGGSLRVTLSQRENHNLGFQGGMMSTWNKFCFTGGMVLVSVNLPGINNILGLWPAVWTMGNLGRAGYGASLEGMWPYTYDACDVGVMPNQTLNGLPQAALEVNGRPEALSFLPGMKLSRCTCGGEDHPGPVHGEDGTFVGRAAPEIDIFEAQVDQNTFIGGVSQSSQWAPMNADYQWFNTSDNLIIPNPEISALNSYTGGNLQQATSVVTHTNISDYQLTAGGYATYGFEYKPGYGDAYVSWIANDQVAWTLEAAGMDADSRVNISARPIPQEPLYILINLGMSKNFGPVDLDHLVFPAVMSIDWVRVYQPQGKHNIGCDPKDFPTMDYIQRHLEAYTNPNLTTWRGDYNTPFPKQSLIDGCSTP